jgi:hypothetical protein
MKDSAEEDKMSFTKCPQSELTENKRPKENSEPVDENIILYLTSLHKTTLFLLKTFHHKSQITIKSHSNICSKHFR